MGDKEHMHEQLPVTGQTTKGDIQESEKHSRKVFALYQGDYRDPQGLTLQSMSAYVVPAPTERSAAQTLQLGLRRKTAIVGGPGHPLLDGVF